MIQWRLLTIIYCLGKRGGHLVYHSRAVPAFNNTVKVSQNGSSIYVCPRIKWYGIHTKPNPSVIIKEIADRREQKWRGSVCIPTGHAILCKWEYYTCMYLCVKYFKWSVAKDSVVLVLPWNMLLFQHAWITFLFSFDLHVYLKIRTCLITIHIVHK